MPADLANATAAVPGAAHVSLGGVLGEALAANIKGRLSHFITGPDSPAIAVFSAVQRTRNEAGDWYGEHAGKWLYAAAKAAARSGDASLAGNVRAVARYLLAQQEPDGYLGTYAPGHRFMRPQAPGPRTWDGAPGVRTWDIWTHAYLILGLLEVHRQLAEPGCLDAARRIGDLCWRTLGDGAIAITALGNHFGMSATVLMDPAVELYFATGEQQYLDLAERVLQQANAEPGLKLLDAALAGADAAEIGTGKAYQLAWNLVGLAKLHRATGRVDYRDAVERVWTSIRDHHLTAGGGPWGGVAHRSREVFNAPGSFSPLAYVETCSTLAWIQLNRELLAISGDARHAEQVERSAYNALLGAQAPDGEDWCYYVFPNGKRVHTTYWRCCKSSGAMALEELPSLAYTTRAPGDIAVNLLGPSSATLLLPDGATITLRQRTCYPFEGDVRIAVGLAAPASFALSIRIPEWADGAQARLPGATAATPVVAGQYLRIERAWTDGDELVLALPMPPRLLRAASRNVQESYAPDGSLVQQEVLRHDYVGVARGPLVYASSLLDGFKTEETLRLPEHAADGLALADVAAADGATILLSPIGRAPIPFVPWYRAGGRVHGAWRLAWWSLAPPAPCCEAPAPAARHPTIPVGRT